jgi:hypothetical protein
MKKLSLVTLAIVFAVCGVNAQKLSKKGQLVSSPKEQKQEVTKLRLNLQKGQVFKQEMNMKMNMKMETQGMKIDTDIPFFALISYNVVAEKDNNFTLETSYDVMRMKMNAMGVDMGFDSENPDKDSPMSPLSGIIGKKFLLTLDELGNVVKVEGLEKLFDAMFEDKKLSEEQRSQMQLLLKSIFSEEKIKENFSSSSIVFPKEPVKEGFEWASEIKQNFNGMNMLSLNKFKIEKIVDDKAIISSKSNYKIDGGFGEGDSKTEIFMDNSKAEAHYTIDLKTGWTQNVKSTMAMSMKVIVKDGNNEISMPMEITAEIYAQTK